MITPREISHVAEHDGVPERTVEKDYAIHWIMLGLATTPLHRRLALKGGTALRVCTLDRFRYSQDIGLAAVNPVSKMEAFRAFAEAGKWIRRESAIQIRVLRGMFSPHADGFGFEVAYTGPLGAMAGRRSVRVDVSAGERVLFHPEERPVNRRYSDIPRKPHPFCYALDEIVAETFRGLLDSVRREPLDVHDLWYLFERGGVDVERLRGEFRAKAEFKKLDPAALVEAIGRKEKALALLWEKRLANQIRELPPFEAALKRVRREAVRLQGGG